MWGSTVFTCCCLVLHFISSLVPPTALGSAWLMRSSYLLILIRHVAGTTAKWTSMVLSHLDIEECSYHCKTWLILTDEDMWKSSLIRYIFLYNNKFKEFEDGKYTFSSFVYVLILDNLKDDKYAIREESTHPNTHVNKCEHCSKADEKKRLLRYLLYCKKYFSYRILCIIGGN